MKLIDNKGRLFGKINVIDLFVLLVILFIAIGGFVRMQQNKLGSENAKKIEVVVHVEEVRQATLDGLEVGDVLNFYNQNLRFGEIKEKRITPFQTLVQTEKDTLVLADVPEKYNLDLVFECDALVSDEVIVVSKEHVRIGNEVYLKNQKISINGHVFEVNVGE